MILRTLSIILILVFLTIGAGCIQKSEVSAPESTGGMVPSVTAETQTIPENMKTPAPLTQPDNTSEPTPAIIQPDPNPTSGPVVTVNITARPTQKPDLTIAFRDRTLLVMDDMQAAKEAILRLYRAGDIEKVQVKSKEFTALIRKNGVISDMPPKMDYIRMNYYEYTDQASQFAQSFTDASKRWISSDKASANSLFDAGVMASDRADIADKRIREFFKDHVQLVQINYT